MSDVFISHASADKSLIEALELLLEGGVGLGHKQIFCTSLEGQGIPPGVDFKAFIGKQLKGTDVVIAVITENFYASTFCMCELGATWIQAKRFIPLLVPPLGYQDLKAVLSGVHCLRIDHPQDIDDLCDTLKPLAGGNFNVPRWNKRKSEFLSEISNIFKKLPKPKIVRPEEYEKLALEKAEYEKEYARADEETKVLRQTIEKLSKLKDSAEVSKIILSSQPTEDQFEELADMAREQISPLSWIARQAMYYWFRGEPYLPESEDFDAAVREVESGLLAREERGFAVRSSHPKIRKAQAAITKLQTFLNECPKEFSSLYEEKYSDLLDLNLRPFWDRHIFS